MSYQRADHINPESLVAEHIAFDPALKENELFWKLVRQCADTIACAQEAGRQLFFAYSHAFADRGGDRVTLIIEGVPLVVVVSEADDGRFHVTRRGVVDDSIKTGADLLAHLKP